MKYRFDAIILGILSLSLLTVGWACSSGENAGETMPITTTSEKAKGLYIKGRELAENVRAQESIEYFEQALELDPNFAMAHLRLSFTAPSTRQFFEHFNAAKALVDKVSDGERMWILGVEAAVNGDPALQQSHYEQLVAAYPKDKRAHNLLGNQLFGQQKYEEALAAYEKSRAIDPDYAPNYNQIGYCYQFLGNFEAAEKALKRYLELIPDDPNPYDSYAELLIKMGKFEESLANYRKAVELNSRFLPSYYGIAANLYLTGRHKEARKELYQQYLRALNNAQRRGILLATAITYIDQEDYQQALRELNDRFQIAEADEDVPTMSNDLALMAGILITTHEADSALILYNRSMELIESSDLTEEVKKVSRVGHLSNLALAAWAKGDLETARARLIEYHEAISESNVGQMQNYHAVAGLIALQAEEYQRAIDHLQQTNHHRNAISSYYLGEAYVGLSETEKGKEYIARAAHFNSVNDLNYALIRARATRRLEELQSAGT